MAERRPLVIIDGRVRRLPAGDTLPGGGGGGGELFVELTNGSGLAVTKGQPIHIVGDGSFDVADFTNVFTAGVEGLVMDDTIANGATGRILVIGPLEATTAQWDAVTGGTGGLVPGVDYYLGMSGTLSTSPPEDRGLVVKRLGAAATDEIFIFQPSPRILL